MESPTRRAPHRIARLAFGWARVEGEQVAAFRTFVTGELFGRCGIIRRRRLRQGRPRQESWEGVRAWGPRGAAAAACQGSPACSASCLARDLCRSWGSSGTTGRLSLGLLIGAEIGEARRLFAARSHILRGPRLVGRYSGRVRGARRFCSRRPAAGCGARAFCIARDGGSCDAQLAPTPLVAILRGVTPDEADSVTAVIVEAISAHRSAAQFTRSASEHRTHRAAFGDKVLVGADTVLKGASRSRKRGRTRGRAQRRSCRHRAGREAWPPRRAGRRHPERSVCGAQGGRVGFKLFPAKRLALTREGVARRLAERDGSLSPRRRYAGAHRSIPTSPGRAMRSGVTPPTG